jgi:hypothetical protein
MAEEPLSQDLSVVVTRSDSDGEIRTAQLYPMQSTVEAFQDMPMIVTMHNLNGYGVSCDATLLDSANEDPAVSGCTLARNGFVPRQSLDMNTAGLVDASINPGTVNVSVPQFRPMPPAHATMENMRMYSRGNATPVKGISGNQLIMTNLGGGAYFMVGKAGAEVARAQVIVTWNSWDDSISAPHDLSGLLTIFHVVPYTLAAPLVEIVDLFE